MAEAPLRAFLVDDEPLGRDALRTILREAPGVEIVGEAGHGAEAVDAVRRLAPDLLLLDVEMPGMDGFGVLEALDDAVPPAVVFVTAYDEHALRAFQVRALDYVTKPFGPGRLLAAVERARRRLAADRALELQATVASLLRSRGGAGEAGALAGPGPGGAEDRSTARLGVRLGSRVVMVDVDAIDWVEADGDYVRLHVGEEQHLLAARMGELAERLEPHGFVRVHRSTLVRLARVREVEREREGGTLLLESGVRLRVSESRWQELTRGLGLERPG